MTLPKFSAQLAGQAGTIDRALREPGRYVIEEKFDGIRALVYMEEGEISIRNRHGEDKGRLKNVPHVERALRALGSVYPQLWKGTVFDGELVAGSWNETMHLLGSAGRKGGSELKFIVFDVPFLVGYDLREMEWGTRRADLDELFVFGGVDPTTGEPDFPVRVSEMLEATPDTVSRIFDEGGEGVIMKDVFAPYVPGDRKHWSKIKQVQTADAFIVGFVRGRGKYRETLGAIELAQYREGKPKRVCQIGGMTDKERHDIWARREKLHGAVVEFEYQMKTKDSYRHPRWLRWREDKKATDCRWEDQ